MKNNNVRSLAGLPKYAAGFAGTLVFRLLSPFMGLWNVSPLMATEFAGSKAYGPWVGGLYGALSMFILDALMHKLGTWTIVTSLCYGAVGVWGAYFFRNRSASAKNFVIASVVGTLFFDLITGVIMGPLMFGMSWSAAAIGQIPFTLRHLAGNVFFAIVLAPWFYRKIMANPKWELSRIFGTA
ncbi:ECF transporter S component [Patescibacteria group bacterium]|nr:ECF transporter S component [Patescibacteria group bacterium]MDE1946938.1 ECF transporter S component [Patescibacteria group bacterium]MDE2011199.1 ECF transporter S component [Patescibacteria group bacterium]MDE2233489.1 ECF transporter S component [Patescibacteria group bacterium]